MTAIIDPHSPTAGATDPGRGLSPRGVWTVARLELTQRVRASRTAWTLGAWLVFVYGFVALAWLATGDLPREGRAGTFYGITVTVVLAFTLLVAPSLSASSISGDREHGVLASLQTTLLTPADIALGKLLAAWLASLTFLALAVPVLVWARVAGGVSGASFAMALVTIALVLLAVSAIGLAISSLAARTISSVALTYVVVGVLVLGMPLSFLLTVPMVSSEEMKRVRIFADGYAPPIPVPSEPTSPPESAPPACREIEALRNVSHTEQTWWLLAPNPFVMVADAAPEQSAPNEQFFNRGMLRSLGDEVRSARSGPPEVIDECFGYEPYSTGALDSTDSAGPAGRMQGGPIWPIGFVTYLVVTVGGALIAVRRLRAPVRTLPRGTRIA